MSFFDSVYNCTLPSDVFLFEREPLLYFRVFRDLLRKIIVEIYLWNIYEYICICVYILKQSQVTGCFQKGFEHFMILLTCYIRIQ
jgi:predicted restriction endonuclease